MLIFSLNKNGGTVKNAKAVIELYEKHYIVKKPYRYSIRDNQEIENQVQILLQAGH